MNKIKPVHWKEFEKFVLAVGCVLKRKSGSHMIYDKEGLRRPVVFNRDTALPVFIIVNNLKVLGVSKKEYLQKIINL